MRITVLVLARELPKISPCVAGFRVVWVRPNGLESCPHHTACDHVVVQREDGAEQVVMRLEHLGFLPKIVDDAAAELARLANQYVQAEARAMPSPEESYGLDPDQSEWD